MPCRESRRRPVRNGDAGDLFHSTSPRRHLHCPAPRWCHPRPYCRRSAKPGAQDYATPEKLRHLWQRVDTEGGRAFVALIFLSGICFWRVGKAASVRPFHLLEAGGVSFDRTKSGGPKGWHRRPLFKFGMSLAGYLSHYRAQQELPLNETIFCGGGAVLEDWLATLLQGSQWGSYAWHSVRRGGTASCRNQKPGLPYFKWWGGWASTGLPCATQQFSLIMESWGHWPCRGLGRKLESLNWSTAYLYGVLLCLGRMRWMKPWVTWGASLVLLAQHLGAVAVELFATVVGRSDGGAPGHESDSSSTSSEGSSSCESSDSDVRIIEPPVGAGVPAGPAFRVETDGQPVGRNQAGGGGGGTAKAQTASPPVHPLSAAQQTSSSGSRRLR